MLIAGQSGSNRKDLTKAKKLDFIVKREDTLVTSFDVYYVDDDGLEQAYDFTGCLLKMHIKKKATDAVAVAKMVLSTDGNELTIARSAEDMDIDAGRYVYDVEMYDMDGENITILYGNFIVLQDVTEFLTVIEQEFDILFESGYETQFQPKIEEKYIFSTTYEYLIDMWKKFDLTTALSLTGTYVIDPWKLHEYTADLSTDYAYSKDLTEEFTQTIITGYTYSITYVGI